ncbi:hypothetical protein SAMN02982994_0347 [Azospirillum lipoferum]|nr:hypothetical protein SAMN02982994_0347 [Azospirillum lipoferum]
MENLPLPDVGTTITHIAGLSPVAQVAAVIALAAVTGLWVWTRRPLPPPQGPDAATVVETMRVTAQALTETSASIASVATSMATIAQQVDGVADDVRAVAADVRNLAEDLRNLTRAVLAQAKQAA